MRKHSPSETALKVAHSVLTLGHTEAWHDRLPPGTTDLIEQLMIDAQLPRYTPRIIRAARKPYMVAAYRFNDWLAPGLFEALGERKVQMNAWALEAIESGIEQVVVLGAGFDTLALRLAPEHSAVRFFEVDHPATATYKRRAVEAHGQPENVHLLPVDLAEISLPEAMAESAAWQESKRTLFIAEGLLMYLRHEEVHGLFTAAAACAPAGSRFAFSHCTPAYATSARGRLNRGALALIGEPFRSWIASDALPEYVGPFGWSILSSVDDASATRLEHFALAELGAS